MRTSLDFKHVYLRQFGLRGSLFFAFVLTCISCGDNNKPSNPTPTPPPSALQVTGLTNDSVPKKSKQWTWGCSGGSSACTYRHAINQNSSHTFSSSNQYTSQSSFIKSSGDGRYYIHVQARNAQNVESIVESVFVILDNTPPLPPTSNIFAAVVSNQRTPQITASNLVSGDVVSVYTDGSCTGQSVGTGTVASGATSVDISLQQNLQQERVYTFYAQITDVAGNVGSCSTTAVISYTLDVTPPGVTGLINDPVAKPEKSWSWGCDDSKGDGCTYRYVIDTNSTHTFSSTDAYSSTTTIGTSSIGSNLNGRYYLHIQVKDAAGNESNVMSFSAILSNNNNNLIVTGLTPDATPKNSKTWRWGCSKNRQAQTCEYRHVVNSNRTHTFSSNVAYNSIREKTIDVGTAYPAGTYYIHVQAKMGNEESLVTTVSVILTSARLIVTGLASDTVPRSSKTWNWGCTKNTQAQTCEYRFVVNTNSTHTFSSNVAYNSTSTLDIEESATYPTGTYYIHVQARMSGEESRVFSASFRLILTVTDLSNDTTPKSSKTWNWGCSRNRQSQTCEYRFVVNTNSTHTFSSNVAYNSTRTETINVGAIYPAGTHYLHVQAKIGNVESAVLSVSVTLQATNLPLEVTGLSDDTSNPISKTWRWGCARDSTAQTCEYRHIVNTNPSHTFSNEPFNRETTERITRNTHTPGIMYYIHVQAQDSSNVRSPVASASVTLRASGLMVTGLQHNPNPAQSVCFPTSDVSDSCNNTTSWGCSYNGIAQTCQYRIAISGSSTHSFSSAGTYQDISNQGFSLDNSSSSPNDPLTRAPGIYYLHVQARDDRGTPNNTSDDRVSSVQSVYGILSTTSNALVHEYKFEDEDRNKTAANCTETDEVWDARISKCKTLVDASNPIGDSTNDAVKKASKTWHWDCSRTRLVTDNKTCQFRSVINQSPTYYFANNESFTHTKTATKTIKTRSEVGTYYLHVQAKDSDGNISTVHTTSAVLDFVGLAQLKTPTPTPCFNKASTTLCKDDVHTLQLHRDRTPTFTVSGLANGEKVKLYPSTAITVDNSASPKTCTIDESKAITSEGTIAFAEGSTMGQTGDLQVSTSFYDGVHRLYVGIKDESQTPAVVKCAYATDPGTDDIVINTHVAMTEYVVYQPIVAGENFTCYLFNNNISNPDTDFDSDDDDWVGKIKCWGSKTSSDRAKFIVAGKSEISIIHSDDTITGQGGSVSSPPTFKTLSAGDSFDCGILEESDSVTCWGSNASGQLGLEDTTNTTAPGTSVNLGCVSQSCSGDAFTAKAIASGLSHTCALLNNDRVKCWGLNEKGQLGQDHSDNIGDDQNEMGNSLQFTKLGSTTKVKAISAGDQHSCAILNNNSVKCWGLNDSGQLGQNNTEEYGNVLTATTNESRPMSSLRNVSGLSGVQAISAGGDYACAVVSGDEVRCWGGNDTGHLGQNNMAKYGSSSSRLGTSPDYTDYPMSSVRNVVLGCDLTGQGNSCPSNKRYKVKTTAIATGFLTSVTDTYGLDGTTITARTTSIMGSHTCAVLQITDSNTDLNHIVKCWGLNESGQLNGTAGASRGWDESHKVEADGTTLKVTP